MRKGVLNEQERQYIRSYDGWTVTDQAQINAFAQEVSHDTYPRWLGVLALLPIAKDPPTKIVGYRPWGRRVSLSIYSSAEIMAGGYFFSYYPRQGVSLAHLDPPGLESLRARGDCGMHMCWLIYLSLRGGPPPVRPHFEPNHWCDTILDNARDHYMGPGDNSEKVRMYPDIYLAGVFTCPGIHVCPSVYDYRRVRESSASSQPAATWISDYAMNPNCREDSPKDMIFLFESKPGWNQHGGPELFTFDNHDPKGGLVLLNGGEVKFIRTREELKQLRWK